VFARRLRDRLPPYMVPAFVEEMPAIPLLPNGKVDRKSLPAPSGSRLGVVGGDYEEPKTDIERRIAEKLGLLLGMDTVSVTDDFFLDLGAHSLIVARLVSTLRQNPDMACLGLSDLYQYPTIRDLARYIKQEQERQRPRSDQQIVRPFFRASTFRVWMCGVLQVTSLVLVSALYSMPGLWIVNQLIRKINWNHPDYLMVTGLVGLGIGVSLLLALVLPVVSKWVLVGRVQPGIYPLWGWFFLRFWLVDKMMAMAPLALMNGTPLLSAYYRLLGAKIGRQVIIASPLLHLPDLVTIGSETAVNTGSHIFCYQVEQNRLCIEPVHIGEKCIIGSSSVLMPGAAMEDGAELGAQSFLGAGENIPAGNLFSGSPARMASSRATKEDAENNVPVDPGRMAGLWTAQGIVVLGVMLVPLTASLPSIIVSIISYELLGIPGLFLAAPIIGLLFVLCLSGLIVIVKKMVLPTIRPGSYPIRSFLYIRKWFVDRLMEMSLGMTNSLYATLYLAPFLRLLGAKIGRMAEISTLSHITPDLLAIEDESFVADIAHVGPAILGGGQFQLAPVHIGKRSFIGNAAFVPGNTKVGDNSLIGVLSVPPDREVPADTTWLGAPPLHLPEREQSKSFPEHLTFAPTRTLYLRRLGYEYFRVTLPATISYLGSVVLLMSAIFLLIVYSVPVTALLLVPMGLLVGCALTLTVAAFKRLLIGSYRPKVRPMWSSFVWRSELVTALYENVVVPWLLAGLTGTPFMGPVFRLFGATIGRRCYLETTFLTEFDLVEVGDDCAIGQACSLQTHLFEDRVMKMSRLRIGDRCTIGPRAVILYDSTLEDGVELDGLSLVMKGETLAGHSRWQGSPARRKELS
jgi:non-ribosomal peptide synthetase-like protein